MAYAIDLFCGAGGCSEGVIQAGFHILFSSDISEMAQKTYMHRHEQLGLIQGKNTWFERADVRKLSGELIRQKIGQLEIFRNQTIPEIDLVMGGPSCQGFSRAGKRSADDPRNLLFGEYVRLVNEIRPKYIVLENVEGFMDMMFVGYRGLDLHDANGNPVEKGLVYSDGSVTPDILRSELERIGYHTLEPRILNAADYGVPQKRKRVIFIGYRGDVVAPTYPNPTIFEGKYITLADAMGDLITDSRLRSAVSPHPSCYQIQSRNGRTPSFDTGQPIPCDRKELRNLELSSAADVVLERFELFKQGETGSMLRSRIKQQGIDLTRKNALIELCSDRLGVHPAEVIERFKAGNVSDDAINVLLTRKNVRRRLNATEPSPTIVTVPDDYINPWEARTISVREMARCQSFDDSFEFLGKRTTGGMQRRTEIPQYTQVGNAVPPLLAKAVASQIMQALSM